MEIKEKTAIELISENIVNAEFKDLSEWNVKCTKDRLLDITGCIIGGAAAMGNAGLVKIVKNWGGKAEAPLFIHGGRVPVGDAAMINCVSARSNDFGAMFANIDGKRIPSHHSETTIPTALTFSDAYAASGKDFLIATLLGDDTTNRIIAAGGWNFNLGWDGTSTLPIFGAVAIAGRFMGLSAEQMKNAFGISVNMIGGTLQNVFDYSLTFKFGQGFSAKNGTLAAEMAREGWTGLDDALLGGKAYYYLYNGTDKIDNPELLTKNLGKTFYMEESFKKYPCGIPNTPFALAGMAIHEEVQLKASEIKEVELILSFMKGGLYYSEPFRVGHTPQVNAIFSYQYTAISSLLRGRLKVQDFSVEAVCEPEILEVIGKSRIVRDPSITKGQNKEWTGDIRLRVTTYSGKIYESTQSGEVSMHKYPTREDMLSKFWDQVEAYHGVSKAKAQKIIDTIDHLENIKNMKELTELLMP